MPTDPLAIRGYGTEMVVSEPEIAGVGWQAWAGPFFEAGIAPSVDLAEARALKARERLFREWREKRPADAD